MKKICLVIPTLCAGGMERVMSELAVYFADEKKIETHLILLSRDKRFYELPSSVIIHEPAFVFSQKKRLLSVASTFLYLRKLLRTIKPESVLSFGERFNSFVIMSGLFLPIKIFISDRNSPTLKVGMVYYLVRRLSYRLATGIVAQTSMAKEALFVSTGHKNIRIICNPIKSMDTRHIETRENIILNVGRMIKSKRHDLLISVFAKCNGSSWRLHLLGDGPEKEKLKAQVKRLGLQERVTFFGNVKDVSGHYLRSKIFAFTSESEGFPNVIGEAMSVGIPVIAFDSIAGAKDLIDHKINGVLVSNLDETTFLEELNLLIEDEELREKLSVNAKIKAKAFSITHIGQQFYEFMQK